MAKRNESIADSFSERSNKAENETMKKILDRFSRLFKWEILNQTKKTQEELNNLSTGLIDEQLNITDKEISDKEKEIIKKITELDNADKNIEGWFIWLDDIDDEDFVSWEKEAILSKLQIEADNEGNTWEWDLNEEEFKIISTPSVLNCDWAFLDKFNFCKVLLFAKYSDIILTPSKVIKFSLKFKNRILLSDKGLIISFKW